MARFSREKSLDCIIKSFADGDTVLCLVKCSACPTWHEKYVRIRGIESWELRSHDRNKAVEARNKLTSQFGLQSAKLHLTQTSLESHGRLVGDIFLNDVWLSAYLVNNGVAWYSSQSNSQ